MNFSIDSLREIEPYSLQAKVKEELIFPILQSLTEFHLENCLEFEKITSQVTNLFIDLNQKNNLSIPFIPVRAFKNTELRSSIAVETLELNSSGTSGSNLSRVYIDQETARRQSIALTTILKDFLGRERLPMLILDSEATERNKRVYSARTAGVLGFSRLSNKRVYVLDDGLNLDVSGLQKFMESIGSGPFLAFGFTSIIWEKIIRELMSLNLRIPINEGLLFHGGGWKRIESKFGSDSIEFKAKVREFLGIHRIHDYYGMAEQAGSIFVECGHGYFHASNFSDVIFRDPNSLEVHSPGGVGLIQVLSVLPLSYPGHSILTEDLGHFLGEDDCHCGRLGKYFKVIGRVPKSEIRGCSDASDF